MGKEEPPVHFFRVIRHRLLLEYVSKMTRK
jgi:hypothetical protein